MSPGQLWILFVVTGKCLTPGPHKKVGALKFWALKQETQTFFSIIETSFLSDFCCLKRSSVTYQFNRKNNGKPEIWRWQGFLKRCTWKCTSGLRLFLGCMSFAWWKFSSFHMPWPPRKSVIYDCPQKQCSNERAFTCCTTTIYPTSEANMKFNFQ